MTRFKNIEVSVWGVAFVAGVVALVVTGNPIAAIAVGAGWAFLAA